MAIKRVDTETGEITASDAHFFILNLGVIPAMREQNALSRTERDILLELCEHLQYRTNMIAERGRPLSGAELATVMQMDAANMSRYLKNLVRKNVLGRWEHGHTQAYFLNPTIARKGEVSPALYEMFEERAQQKDALGLKRLRVKRQRTSLMVMP